MASILSFVQVLFSDALVFVVLQVLILFVVVYAGVLGRKKVAKQHAPHVLRAKYLVLAYSVLSAAFIQAISTTELFAGFKLIITVSNLSVILYLCFFNIWFRAILAHIIVRVEHGGRR
ncbi:MAG TPA: hypothetical protein VJB70_01820 [Candidatus Paceibacterota bacterium]